jgi:hypothetical protein
MDFERIVNNEKQVLINFIYVQEWLDLLENIQTLQKGWNKKIQTCQF